MFKSNRIYSTLILVSTFILCPESKVYSQSKIDFEVNVQYTDYLPGDKVAVVGNVKELGDWDPIKGLILNVESVGDPIAKGSTRLTPPNENSEIQYKFVIIKADDSVIWEERFNRRLFVDGSEFIFEEAHFSSRAYSGLLNTFTSLTITLDASNLLFDGEKPESIALFGNRGNLGFDLEQDRLKLLEIRKDLWSATAMLPYGTWPDLEFKFAWQVDGKWQWEYIPGHANHVAWLDAEASKQNIHMVYIAGTGKILPDRGQPHVDNYGLLQEQMGEAFWATNYGYNFALTQLNEGNTEQALTSYNRYERTKTGEVEIDDFYYQYAAYVHNHQGIEPAIQFIEKRQNKSDSLDDRSAYFEYLKGERLLHEGNKAKARTYFRRVLTNYSGSDMATEYSEHGLMISYLNETEADSVQEGLNLAQQKLFSDTTKTHSLLQYMARAHEHLGNKAELEQTLWQMTQFGTIKQRSTATIRLGQKQARDRRFEEALNTVNTIDSSKVSARILQSKEFLEVRILEEKGERNKANQLKEKLKHKYKGDARLNKYEVQIEGNR